MLFLRPHLTGNPLFKILFIGLWACLVSSLARAQVRPSTSNNTLEVRHNTAKLIRPLQNNSDPQSLVPASAWSIEQQPRYGPFLQLRRGLYRYRNLQHQHCQDTAILRASYQWTTQGETKSHTLRDTLFFLIRPKLNGNPADSLIVCQSQYPEAVEWKDGSGVEYLYQIPSLSVDLLSSLPPLDSLQVAGFHLRIYHQYQGQSCPSLVKEQYIRVDTLPNLGYLDTILVCRGNQPVLKPFEGKTAPRIIQWKSSPLLQDTLSLKPQLEYPLHRDTLLTFNYKRLARSCLREGFVYLKVEPLPAPVWKGKDTSLCPGQTLHFVFEDTNQHNVTYFYQGNTYAQAALNVPYSTPSLQEEVVRKVSNARGCTSFDTLQVNMIKPLGSQYAISGDTALCAFQDTGHYTLPGLDTKKYRVEWQIQEGLEVMDKQNGSLSLSIHHTGSNKLHLGAEIYSLGGCLLGSDTLSLQVKPNYQPHIQHVPAVYCQNQPLRLSIANPLPNARYEWMVDQGEIIQKGPHSIELFYPKALSSTTVYARLSNSDSLGIECHQNSAVHRLEIMSQPNAYSIEGPRELCQQGQTMAEVQYAIDLDEGLPITWEAEGGYILEGQHRSQVSVAWPKAGVHRLSYRLDVAKVCSYENHIEVNVVPKPGAGLVTGNPLLCSKEQLTKIAKNPANADGSYYFDIEGGKLLKQDEKNVWIEWKEASLNQQRTVKCLVIRGQQCASDTQLIQFQVQPSAIEPISWEKKSDGQFVVECSPSSLQKVQTALVRTGSGPPIRTTMQPYGKRTYLLEEEGIDSIQALAIESVGKCGQQRSSYLNLNPPAIIPGPSQAALHWSDHTSWEDSTGIEYALMVWQDGQWHVGQNLNSSPALVHLPIEQSEACFKVAAFYPDHPHIVSETKARCVQVGRTVEIPNIITPNGDGINDQWVISYLDEHPHNEVRLFDRYGNLVKHFTNYKNKWTPQQLLPGFYFYEIRAQAQEPIKGWLLIGN